MPEKYSSFVSHCMGRSVIQLPVDFSESNINVGEFKSVKLATEDSPFHVLVERRKMTEKEFSDHILARRTTLINNATETVDILRLERPLNGIATLFRVQQIKESYQDELHFLVGGNLVIATLDSYENRYAIAEERLVQFISNFSITSESKVNGFCLGALTIQGDFDQENGSYYWRDRAGNTFDIKIDTFRTESPRSLRRRMAGPDSLLTLFHIGHTVLRSRERTAAGMRAQEWLGWTNLGEKGDEKTFKFVLETTRPIGGLATPSIQITFDSAQKLEDGSETRTNLSDDEAMAMWDKVVESIQPAK